MGKKMKDGRSLVAVNATTTRILHGEEDLSTWDAEELRRGQRKDKSGRFNGRAPVVVAQEIHKEQTCRMMSRAGIPAAADVHGRLGARCSVA